MAPPTGSNWNEAVGIHFEDNGRMYVWERGGRVWIKEYGGNTWTKLIDISEEVGAWQDMGMLGFALDPNFRNNGYIYLYYVVDRHHLMFFGTPNYDPAANDLFSATIGRITRYTARSSDGFKSVDMSTRRILLGETKSTGIPILYTSHGVGSLVFGTDGTLLASCGEAANFWELDIGDNSQSYFEQALADGIITPKENVGAFRSQLVDSLSGKILRIDPATGDGVPSNPYYDPAHPRGAKSRVWALGVRNPYRMSLRPNTGSHDPSEANPGVLYFGEVGWTKFEETNVCTGPGQNFGWPIFEGIDIQPEYFAANVENQDAPNPVYPAGGSPRFFYFRDLVKQGTTVAANTPPFNNPYDPGQKIPATIPQYLQTLAPLEWSHVSAITRTWIYNGSGVAEGIQVGAPGSPVSGSMFIGNASVGGIWYGGDDFPAVYKNTYFHADYGAGWIQNTVYDANDKPVSTSNFLSGGGPIVAVATNPVDGGLYYVEWTTTVHKVSFSVNGNLPPKAIATSNKIFGPGPLTVQFTGSGSTDPENKQLSYLWTFGDGTANSTATNPSHTFNAPAGVPTPYTVTLRVTDNVGQSSTATILISVNNTPPSVTITSPVNGSTYPNAPAQIINLTANVSDNESTDNQLLYEWQTFLHHNNHEHADPVDNNHTTTTTITPIGFEGTDTYYYRIALKVTDPAGLSTQAEARVYPNLTNLVPAAAFNATRASGSSPLAIAFDASPTQDPENDALTYRWNFGDGATATGLTATHTYPSTGEYRAVLTATDTAGNVGTASKTIVAGTKVAFENTQTGNPQSEWDTATALGDTTIQGFATDISVNVGGTIQFKVKTTATNYRIDIYRLGYYQGSGARKVATVLPSVSLPQNQPNPLVDNTTGLLDCGNWAVSASWAVPPNAVSGLYIGKLVRTDTGGSSHIYFVVRDDGSQSDLLFQTSDTTWQAYNAFGGKNLYDFFGSTQARAFKVSYNRPFTTRGNIQWHSLFTAEYPMIRWLEANGYDVSYTTGVDTARRGELLLQHKAFLSVGHDEYWAGEQRANVEAARDAGVNLAFFSGNESFWKTRWESSIDPSGTPYRTLVCYKETTANAKSDPTPAWTGTWRDPRFSPPADGGRPENALTGTIFVVNGISLNSIEVPAAYGVHRFWRNTSVRTQAPNTSTVFGAGTLGFEWDQSPDNGFRPPGLMHLSRAVVDGVPVLQDYGSNYATGQATHNLALYRHSSGALVFGAGTVLWSWGLDSVHDNAPYGPPAPDASMQQATVNLFADMGIQPGTLRPGLVPGAPSTDVTFPVSTVTSPASGSTLTSGVPVTLTGAAADTGGAVAGVEVSTDNGATWHPATGRTSWTYSWLPLQAGSFTIKSRAVDDSGNLQTPSAGVNVTVPNNILTIWPSDAVPAIIDSGPDSTGAVELGVKFRSDVSGTVVGIRFYKAAANTGTHIGNLWSNTGTLLASATFTSETASGWQQVNFASPVSITANTVYVASYFCPNAHFSVTRDGYGVAGKDSPPLHAPPSGSSGGNGVFRYGSPSSFPNQTYSASNYWVDVAFQTGPAPTLSSIAVTPSNPSIPAGTTQQFTATGTYSNGSTQNITGQVSWTSSNTVVASINSSGLASGDSSGNTTIQAGLSAISGSTTLTVQPSPLSLTTTSLAGGFVNVAYSATLAAVGGTKPYSWTITSGALPPGLTLNSSSGAISGSPTTTGAFNFTARVSDVSSPAQTASKALSINIAASAPVSAWSATDIPGELDAGANPAVELGVKFRTDTDGTITGLRFYKSAANTGTHIGSIWTSTGTKLGFATFTNETASGWQQVNFATPISVSANTVYVASYQCPNGHFSVTRGYFTSTGVDKPPLHLLRSGVSGPNGFYALGNGFPNTSYQDSNYWVDVVFQTGPPAVLNSIAVTPANPTVLTGATQAFTATGTYSNGSTQNLNGQVAWTSSSSGVASINTSGVATGLAPGTSTITATLSSVSGNTLLTVQSAPLVLTTTSLPNGSVGGVYSASLAATGGILPYGWAITSGALPTGLTLNTGTGAITGTPTATGTFNFTARVSDASSPAQTVSKALSIVVGAAAPLTLWPATLVPDVIDSGPDSTGAVELGVRFQSDVAGTITGIRFYKAAANTGQHVGNLWNSAGTKLATVNFTNESASGWQQATFATPVSIAANTVYVASYLCPNAHFSVNRGYFAAGGYDNAPLHALSNAGAIGNGVFRYGSPSQFPNQTYGASHYWVDVMFLPSSGTGAFMATATPNSVRSAGTGVGTTSASSDADQDAGATSNSIEIVTDSLPKAVLQLPYSTTLAASGEGLPCTWAVVQGSLPEGLKLAENSGLIAGSAVDAGSYSLMVQATSVSDSAKVAARSLTLQVKRVSPVPILIVSNSRNGMRTAVGPVLQAEGLNSFDVVRTSLLSTEALNPYEVVVLEPTALTARQAALFTEWVDAGGNLVSIRPDRKLSDLFGATRLRTTASEGYLLVDPLFGFGTRVQDNRIRFRGVADRYRLGGAWSVASFQNELASLKQSSLVTLRNVGSKGGQAVAFGFDPQWTVESNRQGNRLGGDAEGQRQLLVNMITLTDADKNLIPRFWYHPEDVEESTKWKRGRDASVIRYLDWDSDTQSFLMEVHPDAKGLVAMLPVPTAYQVDSVTRDGEAVSFEVKTFKGISYAWFPAVTGDYEVRFVTADR